MSLALFSVATKDRILKIRMDRARVLAGAALAGLTIAAGCGGGSTGSPIPQPTIAPASTVKFTITVPLTDASGTARRPMFDAPSGTQSVSFQLTSVNGSPQSATPTVVNVSSTATGCSAANGTLTCTANVPGIAGSDLFTVTSYPQSDAKGTAIASGTVQVSTTAGTTTTAPVTLTGTIASIAVSVQGVAVPGVSSTLPVVVIAKDAKGATIMGTYTSPVTLADSDTSGVTTLSKTSLLSSTDAAAVTLSYTGAALKSATISASSTGVASSSITNATFAPSGDYVATNGMKLTYALSQTSTYVNGTSTPSPAQTASGTEVDTYSTGKTFNNLQNLVDVNQVFTPAAGGFAFPWADDFYYSLNQTAGGATINEAGWVFNQPNNTTMLEDQSVATGGLGWQLLQLPFKAGNTWDSGSAYKETVSYKTQVPTPAGTTAPGATTSIYAWNKDGSYTDTWKTQSNDGTITTYTETMTVTPNGAGTDTYAFYDANNVSQGTETDTYGTPVPAPSGTPGYVIPVTQLYVPASPSPGASPVPSPTPLTYNLRDWYPGGAQPPSPLQSDASTDKGSVAIPAACNLSSTIATTGEQIEDVYSDVDPFGSAEQRTSDSYYAQGLGLVCMIEQDTYTSVNVWDGSGNPTPRIYTWNAVQALTPSTLQSALRQSSSMSQAAMNAGFALQNAFGPLHAEHRKLSTESRLKAVRARMASLRHA